MAAAIGTDQAVAGGDVDGATTGSPLKDASAVNQLGQDKSHGRRQPAASTDKALEPRADPDAQTTVTDFLDFTEYLPSDVIRSLTLIGKLDEAYTDSSLKVHELTTTWGQLPTMAVEDRPPAANLRADISEILGRAVSSRTYAHDEAVRMSENVNRHYNKAKVLLAKLQEMMDHYPTEEVKSPVVPKSPHMVRAKPVGEDGQKIRRHRIPRVTVPGEVLAPYEIEYDTDSDNSDISSDDDSDIYATGRRTPGAPRIKLITNKSHKPNNRLARPVIYSSAAMSAAAAANAAALLNPPPENAVIGSSDAPWLQLTQYELAKLRKRMKKNATWTPSETMVARELKALGRGPDEYREAKKKAEDEGKEFNPSVPSLVVDDESGVQHLPAGAISAESLGSEEVPTSNRGMKLNEAKKLKREALAKQAAEEAEESARKMAHAAKMFMVPKENGKAEINAKDSKDSKEAEGSPSPEKSRTSSRSNGNKRKRDGDHEAGNEQLPDGGSCGTETTPPRPQAKRSKMETPVPPPRPGISSQNSNTSVTDNATLAPHPGLVTPGGTVVVTPQPQTPVPIPVPPQSSARSATSPTPLSLNNNNTNTNVTTTTIPVKAPAMTPVPLPRTDRRKSITPVPPPTGKDGSASTRRETRGRTQPSPSDPPIKQSSSRGNTPGMEGLASRRPGSRGSKAMSQEPPPASSSSLAAERPRRTSTARITPGPEMKQAAAGSSGGRRPKRPAPGVVSTTNSGGSSAVGKRKAAPKKKARATKKDKGQVVETEMEDVDDEGNPIDPDEPRYCLCNRVSFGTMIQCDNLDNCKQEWFHLECVGMEDIPARTTKWYCPDCRKLLNIGEKGEVSARGIKK